MFLFIPRLLYNEIVTLFRLMFFIIKVIYVINLFKNTITQFDFLLKPLSTSFLNSFIDSNEVSV